MTVISNWIDKNLYERYSDNWDDEMFRELILDNVSESSSCLDFGAGRGRITQMHFKGLVSFVAGVDVDSAVLGNISVDEVRVIDDSGLIPYDDETFDVVFADNVMEHVVDPTNVLSEVNRVLKNGGIFIAKTPNKYHYMPTIARLTPLWFHRFYNKKRGRNYEDTFPTQYRCNSKNSVSKVATDAGFAVACFRYVEGRPEYLRFFSPLYIVGSVYERIVNSHDTFAPLRCVLMFTLKKI